MPELLSAIFLIDQPPSTYCIVRWSPRVRELPGAGRRGHLTVATQSPCEGLCCEGRAAAAPAGRGRICPSSQVSRTEIDFGVDPVVDNEQQLENLETCSKIPFQNRGKGPRMMSGLNQHHVGCHAVEIDREFHGDFHSIAPASTSDAALLQALVETNSQVRQTPTGKIPGPKTESTPSSVRYVAPELSSTCD